MDLINAKTMIDFTEDEGSINVDIFIVNGQ